MSTYITLNTNCHPLTIETNKSGAAGVRLFWKGVKVPLVQRFMLDVSAEGSFTIDVEWVDDELVQGLLRAAPEGPNVINLRKSYGEMCRIRSEFNEYFKIEAAPFVAPVPTMTLWERLMKEDGV
jgi:hypothetical protein